MPFWNKFPYTDFHELNLDWIISKVGQIEKNLKETLEAMAKAITAQEKAEEAQEKAEEAQENAETAETNAETAETNTREYYNNLITHISNDVTGWLDDNVDPVGSAVTVDSSLTISGSAGDAKVTGDNIEIIKNNINHDNDSLVDGTQAGTFPWTLIQGNLFNQHEGSSGYVIAQTDATKNIRVCGNEFIQIPYGIMVTPKTGYRMFVLAFDSQFEDQSWHLYRGMSFQPAGTKIYIPPNPSMHYNLVVAKADNTDLDAGNIKDFFEWEIYTKTPKYNETLDIVDGIYTVGSNEYSRPVSIRDFECKNHAADIVIDEDSLTFAHEEGASFGELWTEAEKIKLTFRINNRGWIVYRLNTYSSADQTFYMMPLLGTSKGKRYTINYYTGTSSSEEFKAVNDAWENATTNTTFILEKDGSTLTGYVGDTENRTQIFVISDCNILGFVSSTTYQHTVSDFTVTHYYDTNYKGLEDRVFDLEAKFKAGTANTILDRFHEYKVLFVGDSITEKNYRASTNYVEYLDAWLSFDSYTNDGKSATGIVRPVSPGAGEYQNYYDRLLAYSEYNYDVVLIMGNMNDYSGGIFDENTLGQFGDDTFSTEYGAVNKYIQKVIELMPTAKIGWIISTPRDYSKSSSSNTTVLYGNESVFEDASKAIKDVCSNYSIPVLDLYHESNLMPWNSTNCAEYFSINSVPNGDGVHPNADGQKILAYKIYDFICKNF